MTIHGVIGGALMDGTTRSLRWSLGIHPNHKGFVATEEVRLTSNRDLIL